MHPLDAFDRIYIINLASRTDRRAEMAEQLQRIGLSIDAPTVRVFEAVRPVDAGPFPTIGTRGCFMSHLGVLREARDDGLKSVLILEDDLNFSADFVERAPEVCAQLRGQDWSMFYGGHLVHGVPPPGVGSLEINAALNVQNAHFLAFRGPAIGEMATYLEAMLRREPGAASGGPMHVDGAYCWFRAGHPDRRTFIAVPELGYQRSSRTDIHVLHWKDRTPLVREVSAFFRRMRNRWRAKDGRP